MPQQVFGPEAAVSMLNRALNDQSPSNAVFKNQVASAGTTDASINAFANTFLGGFKTLTDYALSTKVLTNMGLLPNAELQAALRDYFAANGAGSCFGIPACPLTELLFPAQCQVQPRIMQVICQACRVHSVAPHRDICIP